MSTKEKGRPFQSDPQNRKITSDFTPNPDPVAGWYGLGTFAKSQRQTPPKRQPAYSKALRQATRDGLEPVHGVAVYLDQKPPVNPLCIPLACFADTDPASIDWGLCRGRDVHVAGTDRDPVRLKRLIEALKAAKPRRLQVHRLGELTEFVILGGGSCQ